MYKTFELLRRSFYVIIFWSIIFYILKTRQIGVSFSEILIETIIGWVLLVTVMLLFSIYIAHGHRVEKDRQKKLITKSIVEDGMKFTVGGHTRYVDLLPENFQIKSLILIDYESDRPDEQKIKDAEKINAAVSDLIENQNNEELYSISEREIFDKKEGDGSNMYVNITTEKPVGKTLSDEEAKSEIARNFRGQSEEDILKEANEGVKKIDEISDQDKKRSISKGVLFYQYQFNALYSYIVNKEIDQFHRDCEENKVELNGKLVNEKQKEEILAGLQVKADDLRAEIDKTLMLVLDCIPTFKYKGITSTTPEIKTRRQLDFKNYQLLIFTSLFPFIKWVDLRANRALNSINPTLMESYLKSLSLEEKAKLNKKELGLSLRDKRILWNARKMYDIYIHRDRDLVKDGYSPYNMPVSFDENQKMFNPLEETVALCEFLRQALKTKKVNIPKPKKQKKTEVYSVLDVINIANTLLFEKNRFNTNNAQDRIGLIKDGLIYIDISSFIPKFNGRFKEMFPENANLKDFNEAIFMFYTYLVDHNLLSMKKLKNDISSNVEVYEHKHNGELFSVNWNFGKGNTVSVSNTLIIHATNLFRDIASRNPETNASPNILDISDMKAIPLSAYSKEIEKKIQRREQEEAIQNELDEAKSQNIQNQKSEAEVLNSMNKDMEIEQAEQKRKNNDLGNQASYEKTDSTPDEAATKRKASEVVDKPIESEDLTEAELRLIHDTYKFLDANQRSLKTINTIALENEVFESAQNYQYREVQVLSLHVASIDRSLKGVKREFAVNFDKKQEVIFLQYSRSEINEAEKNLDFIFIKIVDQVKKGKILNTIYSKSTDGSRITILGRQIPRLFNVFEQMAIYTKLGSSKIWHASKSEYRGKKQAHNTNEVQKFDEIAVIECLSIFESSEEYLYKRIDKKLWNEDRAFKLFDLVERRLIAIQHVHALLGIKVSTDARSYLVPKVHLGRLNRAALEINSFLAYSEQNKKELPAELQRFTDALYAYEVDGIAYIKFDVIRGSKSV